VPSNLKPASAPDVPLADWPHAVFIAFMTSDWQCTGVIGGDGLGIGGNKGRISARLIRRTGRSSLCARKLVIGPSPVPPPRGLMGGVPATVTRRAATPAALNSLPTMGLRVRRAICNSESQILTCFLSAFPAVASLAASPLETRSSSLSPIHGAGCTLC